MEEARFTLRIHPILLNKMRHIAKNNGRSINKEIEQILIWVIDDYERKCGRIQLEAEELPKSKTEIAPLPDTPMDMLFKIDE